jgi:hypothetical protein
MEGVRVCAGRISELRLRGGRWRSDARTRRLQERAACLPECAGRISEREPDASAWVTARRGWLAWVMARRG